MLPFCASHKQLWMEHSGLLAFVRLSPIVDDVGLNLNGRVWKAISETIQLALRLSISEVNCLIKWVAQKIGELSGRGAGLE
jgi:hypothetical protein